MNTVKENEETNIFQKTEQNKTLEKDLNELERSDLPGGKAFKTVVLEMLIELRRTIHEKFNRDRRYKKELTVLENSITELKTGV